MTKFILIVWIGVGYSQTLTIDHFDTMAECKAAAAVLKAEIAYPGWSDCHPYTFAPEIDHE